MNETLPQDADTLSTDVAQVFGPVWAVIGRAKQLHRRLPEFPLDWHVGQAAAQLAPRVARLYPWMERDDLRLFLAASARATLARSDSGKG